MKIGIDCRMYSSRFTGIGRYVYELTENIFRLDRENEYVLFFNEAEFTHFTPPNDKVEKVLVNAPHYSLAEQTKFLHVLNKEKLDLMHFTHFNAPIFYNRPSVVTIHDLTLSFYPGKKMAQPLQRFGYHLTIESAVRKAKKIIAVSQNTKKDLQQIFKTPDEKISVIYEGVHEKFHPAQDAVDFKKIQDVKEKFIRAHGTRAEESALSGPEASKEDKPYLLYTGVWRSHKNLPNLLQAFHILKNDYDFDGYLVITGRPDPLYAPELEEKALSLKLENDVIFTGLVEEKDLVPLYDGALAYVFPSLYEGFGLPPLEAMQCGVPVIASNISSIPEICGQGNAVFFNPADPQDMAEKIFQVTSQKSVRENLIANGLQRVKQFSWQKMTEQTLKVYSEALGKK
jgi:glycosyltransferase involved in cell wall biosynthesis